MVGRREDVHKIAGNSNPHQDEQKVEPHPHQRDPDNFAAGILQPRVVFFRDIVIELVFDRSEARRAGQECRSRWSPYP